MEKRIQAAIGLILLAASLAAQPIEDVWPATPNLSPRPGDEIELTGTIDGEQVSITVGEMRQALWYQQVYGEARLAIFAREAMIEQRDNQIDYVTGEYETAESRKIMWRNMFLVTAGIFTTYMALDAALENF